MIAGQARDFFLSIVSTSSIRSIDPTRLLPSLLGLFQRQVPGSRLVPLGRVHFGSLCFLVPSCGCQVLHLVVVVLYLVLVYENENGLGRLLPAVATSIEILEGGASLLKMCVVCNGCSCR